MYSQSFKVNNSDLCGFSVQNLNIKEDRIFVKTQDYSLTYDAYNNVESCRVKEYIAKSRITSLQKIKNKYDKNPYVILINPVMVLDNYMRPFISTNQVFEIVFEKMNSSGKVHSDH